MKLGKILYWFTASVVVFLAGAALLSALSPGLTAGVFVVRSGSMQPAIPAGSLVLVKKEKSYGKDDIVTFVAKGDAAAPAMLTTHRIIGQEEASGQVKFITKGDANSTEDGRRISNGEILGKVVSTFPFLGYPVSWAKTLPGLVLLIVVPATIIAYQEALGLKKDIERRLRKKKTKGYFALLKKFLYRISVLYLLFNLSQIPSSGAFFNASGTSGGNQVSAGWWGVKINEVYYDVDGAHGEEGTNEWIEIYNPTGEPIDISGWTIKDNNSSDIIPSSPSIPAGGYAVISPDESTWGFWSIPDEAVKIVLADSKIGSGLNNEGGDRIVLELPSGVEIDAVSWEGDTTAFSPSVDGVDKGHSISRKVKGVDTDSADDWMDTHSGSDPAGPNPGTNPHPPQVDKKATEENADAEEPAAQEENKPETQGSTDEDSAEPASEAPSETQEPETTPVLEDNEADSDSESGEGVAQTEPETEESEQQESQEEEQPPEPEI